MRLFRGRSALPASLSILGLATGVVLLTPKIVALLAGDLAVIGTGFVANLALIFGSLMFLREALRIRRQAPPRHDGEL